MRESLSETKIAPESARHGRSGFTLIEMLIAIAIIAILSAISYPIYTSSIDKAKVTKGINTLETIRKAMENYHINYGTYPPTLDIASGLDSAGKTVLTPELLSEFKSNLSSFVEYTVASDDYTFTARAIDTKHSLLVLKAGSVVAQGP